MAGMATIVAFHAHPDDEVLLTGGTLALLAATGHRVVIAMACAGGLGKGARARPQARLDELRASAKALGVARVVHLGYADSGHGPILFDDPPGQVRFARADLEEAAAKLATLIREENADLLLSYDANGGNGHRDHVKVHQVGARAAEMAGEIRLLEATFPRERVRQIAAPLRALRLVVRYDVKDVGSFGSPRSAITHRVDVRRFAAQKQAALAAHRSQLRRGRDRGRSGGLFRLLVALPVPVFGLVCRHEWFAEPGAKRADLAAAPTSRGGDILTAALPLARIEEAG
jgi:LmbE family N-acetylglucosaminyl deacetylase